MSEPTATERQPDVINAYEAGYQVGRRHGLQEAAKLAERASRSAQPTFPKRRPSRDVSASPGEGSSAAQSGVSDDAIERPFAYTDEDGSSVDNRIASRVDAREPATTRSAGVAASIGVVDR